MKRLIQQGMDIEEKYAGWSPLMKAAEEGHSMILKILLENKADLEVTNHKGRSALSFAAAPSQNRPTPVEALKMLLESGARSDLKDDSGKTPKERAQREKREDAVEVFDKFERRVGAKCASQNPPIGLRPIGGGLFRPLKMSP